MARLAYKTVPFHPRGSVSEQMDPKGNRLTTVHFEKRSLNGNSNRSSSSSSSISSSNSSSRLAYVLLILVPYCLTGQVCQSWALLEVADLGLSESYDDNGKDDGDGDTERLDAERDASKQRVILGHARPFTPRTRNRRPEHARQQVLDVGCLQVDAVQRPALIRRHSGTVGRPRKRTVDPLPPARRTITAVAAATESAIWNVDALFGAQQQQGIHRHQTPPHHRAGAAPW